MYTVYMLNMHICLSRSSPEIIQTRSEFPISLPICFFLVILLRSIYDFSHTIHMKQLKKTKTDTVHKERWRVLVIQAINILHCLRELANRILLDNLSPYLLCMSP